MAKHNAFFFFTMERKREMEERAGRRIDVNDAVSQVTEEWQSMNESEREKYRTGSLSRKREPLDCYGVPLRLREERMQRKKMEAQEMQEYIQGMVKKYHESHGLSVMPVTVVSGSSYLKTDEGQMMPAEISLLKFNFKKGITKLLHAIMKVRVPMAYRLVAMQHSKATHDLLAADSEDVAEKIKAVAVDYQTTAYSIMEFLNEDEEMRPLYTLHKEMDEVKLGLQTILGDGVSLKVYSLDLLFQNIYSLLLTTIPLFYSTELLTQSLWEYHPVLPCKWHKDNGGECIRFCTLSCTQRWVYLMCQHLDMVRTFGVMPQVGIHYPPDEPNAGTIINLSSLLQNMGVSFHTPGTRGMGASSYSSPNVSYDMSGAGAFVGAIALDVSTDMNRNENLMASSVTQSSVSYISGRDEVSGTDVTPHHPLGGSSVRENHSQMFVPMGSREAARAIYDTAVTPPRNRRYQRRVQQSTPAGATPFRVPRFCTRRRGGTTAVPLSSPQPNLRLSHNREATRSIATLGRCRAGERWSLSMRKPGRRD